MNYTVTFESQGNWVVKGFENGKISCRCATKGDAVSRALELARNSGGSYVLVYSEHGTGFEKIPV